MFKKVARSLLFYALFFIPFFVFGLLIWTFLVDGKLYYCSDKVPFLDFIPPFVHGTQYGDYWIADPKLVWLIWFFLLSLILLVPHLLAQKLTQKKRTKKHKA